MSIPLPEEKRKENFSCLIQFLINHANRPIYLRRWFPSIKLRERSCNLSRGMSVLTERRRNVIGSTYMILVYSPPATKEMQTWINSGETERYQIRCEHITCCILHVIQSRARWYATVPLREKRRVRTIGRITCLEDYACALLVTISANRSSNGQSKQGLSCIVHVHRFNLQVRSKAEDQTRLSFVHPKRRALPLTRGGREVPWRWIARKYVGREKDTVPSKVEILVP